MCISFTLVLGVVVGAAVIGSAIRRGVRPARGAARLRPRLVAGRHPAQRHLLPVRAPDQRAGRHRPVDPHRDLAKFVPPVLDVLDEVPR